jgi:tRNA pseudouridine55 synthase
MSGARSRDAGWSGLLPVDKPAGPTSHDVVARARRALGTRAIGHLGTLDPAATGLLVLVVGAATRCAVVWQGGAKTYEGTARFGIVTDSQDLSGHVIEESGIVPSEAGVRAAASALTGDLLQVPPMVSAIQVGGERLHAIARRGGTVEREARPVRVDGWEWLGFAGREARFRVRCSGGTYVRTLVHDLGARLGCGAALAALRRTRSEPFDVSSACPGEALEPARRDATLSAYGIPLDRALDVLPSVALDGPAAGALGHGRPVAVAAPPAADARGVVMRDAAGRALALADLRPGEGGTWAHPRVVFPWAVREGRAA